MDSVKEQDLLGSAELKDSSTVHFPDRKKGTGFSSSFPSSKNISDDEFEKWIPSSPKKIEDFSSSNWNGRNSRSEASFTSPRSNLMSPVLEFRISRGLQSSVLDKTPIRGSGRRLSLPSCSEDFASPDGISNSPRLKGKRFGKLFKKRSTSGDAPKSSHKVSLGLRNKSCDSPAGSSSSDMSGSPPSKTSLPLHQVQFSSMIDSSQTLTSDSVKFLSETNFPSLLHSSETNRYYFKPSDDDQAMLLWRRILALCKHDDMILRITRGSFSSEIVGFQQNTSIRHSVNKTTNHVFRRLNHDDDFFGASRYSDGRDMNQKKVASDNLPLLSSDITSLGSIPSCIKSDSDSSKNDFEHKWESSFVTSEIDSSALKDLKIVDLINAAKESYTLFAALVKSTAQFVNKRHPNSVTNSFVVDIKSADAIKQKAERKYNGDVHHVKDILRGYLVVDDEESILKAILCIKQNCEESSGSMKIVRFKNLFRMDELGTLVPTNLLTGYRHIVFNLRMPNGVVTGE